MNYHLLRKTWLETRLLLAGLFSLVFGFYWFRVWLVSRLDTSNFKEILNLVPENFRKMLSVDVDWMITYTGRLAYGWEEPLTFLLIGIWAVSRGTDTVSGEITKGTMEMMMAQPISRNRLLWLPTCYGIFGCFLLAFASWLGTVAGVCTVYAKEISKPSFVLPGGLATVPIPFTEATETFTPMWELTNIASFLPAVWNLFAFGFCCLGIATLCSSPDRYRWRSVGIASAILILMYALKLTSLSADFLGWMSYLTIFGSVEPAELIRRVAQDPAANWNLFYHREEDGLLFGQWTFHLTLLGIGLFCLLLSSRIFHKRDIPAPL